MTESTHAILKQAEEEVRSDFPMLSIEATAVVTRDRTAGETLVEISRDALLFAIGCDDVSPAGALLVNSETLALAAHSACPVAAWRGNVIRPDTRPVVVGIDGASESAITRAFEFAHRYGAPLIAIHAWSTRREPGDVTIPFLVDRAGIGREQRRQLTDALAPLRQRYPTVDVNKVVEATNPSRLLVKYASQAQLVVVGRSRRGRLASALLGSTNLNLLHHSPAPVMICP